jgi:N-acyl-D-amino-acid deacylase
MEFDFMIRGGRVMDGTGNPWYLADVGIKDGKLAKIGSVEPSTSLRTLDAAGMIVCPGFIDIHTHSDISLLQDGDGQSMVRQGVTLNVIGERLSVAPLVGPVVEEYRLEQRQRYGFDVDWTDLDGYFSRVLRQGIALNLASAVSPQQIKRAVVGLQDRPATPDELAEMRRLTSEAMAQGAVGLTCAWHGGGPEFPDEVAAMAEVGRH